MAKEWEQGLAKALDKKEYLKEQYEKAEGSTKVEVKQQLIKLIRENALIKLDNQESAEYLITYDSFGEGIEPIYFWVLDFLKDPAPSGLGYEVEKNEESYEASASSAFFGEMGTRASVMQDRAMKMMQTINTVIRSIINLLYDLKEFQIRLTLYDDLKHPDSEKKKSAELGLRALWMDVVDIKRGRGSINGMSQDLQFVTLRDAFMFIQTLDKIKDMDLNERVKGILKRKFEEYSAWKVQSEQELRKRYNIEKQYLKSQVASLKLYTKWTKPYLKAAQQLGQKDFKNPALVTTFNNMMIELNLIGKKAIKPASIDPTYEKLDFKQKLYSVLEVNFMFRSIPQSIRAQQGQQYVQNGLTEIRFRCFVLSEDEMKMLQEEEFYEDLKLVEEMTDVSLGELQKDLEEIFKEEKKPEPPKKKEFKFQSPFGSLTSGFKESIAPFKHMFKKEDHAYQWDRMKSQAKKTTLDNCMVLYDIYKKAHGMLSWKR